MNQINKLQPDPELELLRLKGLQSSSEDVDNNSDIDTIVRQTSRIHAAFLFHSPKTLQPLLRAIGETNQASFDSGWQCFGDKLGLDVSILKVINNNQFNHEDPVYNTLLHYVQYEDATIGKILMALKEMGRIDVISRTKDVLKELIDLILSHEQELMQSSFTSGNCGAILSNGAAPEEALNEILIRPQLIPEAPFIMKNVQASPLLSTLLLQGMVAARTNVICSESFTRALASEALTQASPVNPSCDIPDRPSQNYSKKVMLTFASDGADIAEHIAKVFRKKIENKPRIGVLILGEQRNYLHADPHHFITTAFLQVDYVVPILTEEYLNSILRREKSSLNANDCLDGNYAPYIYKLMMSHYAQNNCMNSKVRCLVPDKCVDYITKHLLMASPLFRAWERSSCCEEFAERIRNSVV